MAVKVRLMRIGAKGRPFYRVVAVDERKKRTGSYLELLGTYNPLTNPKEINLKQDRIDAWVKNGAQLSNGFLRIIGKAPQRVARKPKKDRGNTSAPAAEPTPTVEEKATEPVVEEIAQEVPVESKETSEVVEATAAENSATEETVENSPATEEISAEEKAE
jgi:small subunit ribosomal protein S16